MVLPGVRHRMPPSGSFSGGHHVAPSGHLPRSSEITDSVPPQMGDPFMTPPAHHSKGPEDEVICALPSSLLSRGTTRVQAGMGSSMARQIFARGATSEQSAHPKNGVDHTHGVPWLPKQHPGELTSQAPALSGQLISLGSPALPMLCYHVCLELSAKREACQ